MPNKIWLLVEETNNGDNYTVLSAHETFESAQEHELDLAWREAVYRIIKVPFYAK